MQAFNQQSCGYPQVSLYGNVIIRGILSSFHQEKPCVKARHSVNPGKQTNSGIFAFTGPPADQLPLRQGRVELPNSCRHPPYPGLPPDYFPESDCPNNRPVQDSPGTLLPGSLDCLRDPDLNLRWGCGHGGFTGLPAGGL